ncbi:L-type lectin family protein [Myroides sp. LJL115]
MKRICDIIILCFCTYLCQAQESNGSVYELPLTTTQKPSNIIDLLGRNSTSGAQRFTENGIVLTNQRQAISGFVVDDLEISLASKATFEFDYAMASINEPGYSQGGGLAFVLYDAATSVPTLGYGYSAFGYSVTAAVATVGTKGFSGGYLAIGLDNYSERSPNKGGGFHGQGVLQMYELREGIGSRDYAKLTVDQGIKNDNFIYSTGHITFRGGTIPMSTTRGNPVLLTKYFGGNSVKPEYVTMAELDYQTGDYNFGHNPLGDLIDISDGGSAQSPNFRRMIVDVSPYINEESGKQEGTYINVSTLINGNKVVLIEDFLYLSKFQTYSINAKNQSSPYEYNQPIPQKVKFGFTASTGEFTLQAAIVKNVKVTSSDFIVIPPTSWQMCVSQSNQSAGASSSAILFKDSELDLDKQTFYFLDENGGNMGQTFTQDNVGTWVYDPNLSQVTLTISNQEVKPQEQLMVNYAIKDTSGKSSKNTELSVLTIACGAMLNPQIESKAIKN